MYTKNHPRYGMGEHTVEVPQAALLDERELADRLIKRFQSPDYRPPRLPEVALKLLEVSRKPDVDLNKIIDLIQSDALLAGELLKTVRSPMYSGRGNIRSVRAAVARLGVSGVRDLVMQVSLNMRLFRVPQYEIPMQWLRRHSMCIAHLSATISRYTSIDGEFAFLCGLLHDVGIAGLLLSLVDQNPEPPELIYIWPAIQRAHQEASEILAKHWQLPAEITLVVANHHRVNLGGYPHPLIATLIVAEAIEAQISKSDSGVELKTREGTIIHEQQSTEMVRTALDALGIGRDLMAAIMKDASRIAASI
ncbi:MAG: HDOD domain-containing protein [Myxococcales bacterium]|nr:HDOD domain-containing protein [Myxococcales bacterium]